MAPYGIIKIVTHVFGITCYLCPVRSPPAILFAKSHAILSSGRAPLNWISACHV